MYKFQSNSCIYCFKLTNTILLLIMSICILSFGNIHLFNIDTNSCNHIGLSIICSTNCGFNIINKYKNK